MDFRVLMGFTKLFYRERKITKRKKKSRERGEKGNIFYKIKEEKEFKKKEDK